MYKQRQIQTERFVTKDMTAVTDFALPAMVIEALLLSLKTFKQGAETTQEFNKDPKSLKSDSKFFKLRVPATATTFNPPQIDQAPFHQRR